MAFDRAFVLPSSASAEGLPAPEAVAEGGEAPPAVVATPTGPKPVETVRMDEALARGAERVGYDPTALPGNAFDGRGLFGTVAVVPAGGEAPVGVVEPDEPLPSLHVTSVMPGSGGGGLAVINGASVRVGGMIPGTGWRLAEVTDKGIVATRDGRRMPVVLPRP